MIVHSVNDIKSVSDLKRALTDVTEDATSKETDSIAHQMEALSFDDPILRAMRLRDVAIGSETLPSGKPDADAMLSDSNHQPASSAPYVSKAWVLDNHDPNDTLPQTLDAEMRRLLVLRSYLLLDTKEDTEAMGFDAITRLASRMLNCPIALVSLSDIDRQWFLSEFGLPEPGQISRKNAFCAHAILSTHEDVMVVPDASQDPRFQDNPSVTGPLHVRFYAGAPLMAPEGYKLGTLCVIGNEPRPEGLAYEEKQNLRDLADMVVETMARRRKEKIRAHFHNPKQTIAQMAHELLTPLMGVQLNLSTLSEDTTLISQMSVDEQELLHNALYCSEAVSKICATAIEELRQQQDALQNSHRSSFFKRSTSDALCTGDSVKTSNLIQALYVILETFPKNVPVSISVDPNVPKFICIDELKVFRSALNFLSNACQRTLMGSIQLSIRLVTSNNQTVVVKDDSEMEMETKEEAPTPTKERKFLMVECMDTAPNIPVENYPLLYHPSEYYEEQLECVRPTADGGCEPICRMQTQGLGLYSVAVQIGSIGGEYGYKPRVEMTESSSDEPTMNGGGTISMQGSIFWFKVPIMIPEEQ